jgi:sialate O-acetylesterase
MNPVLCLFAVPFLAAAATALADVRLPALFSDHAVLQAGVAVPVWGWATAGERVTVTFGGQRQTATTDADGRWSVKLTALTSGTAGQLVVEGKNRVAVEDVLVGEVWLGSGQSNMAMTVNRVMNFEQEKAAANFPQIRMFREESKTAATAQTEAKGQWLLCTPDNVPGFSATLYFFGREVHRTLNAPVGLINSSVGGTPIEQWIAPETQKAAPELRAFFESAAQATPGASETAAPQAQPGKKKAAKKAQAPSAVGGLYNGKIAPLVPYAVRGILWYQGEANSVPAKAPFYGAQLKLLITDWRARWGSELPFAWVQLPNFGGPGRDWPTVREGMLQTLALPRTGMAITMDIGEEKDIHPKNKQEVGRRLALWALGTVYGRKVAATSGPLPAGHEVHGGEIVLTFLHTNGGLVAKGGAPTGFVIAGEDRQWKPAQARIEGDRVIVSSAEVKRPVAARYAWENFPTCNLFNGAGLPASPFRTDTWKGGAP